MSEVLGREARDQLARLAEAATPEPWRPIEDDDGWAVWHDDGRPGTLYICTELRQGHDGGENDAAFIAAARTAVPVLIAMLDDTEKQKCAICDRSLAEHKITDSNCRGFIADQHWLTEMDRLTVENQQLRDDVERLTVNWVGEEAEANHLRETISEALALHTEKQVATSGGSLSGLTTWRSTCAYCSQRHVGGYETVGWPCETARLLGAVVVGVDDKEAER